MKKIRIKSKQLGTFISNQGYFCDGNFIIKKDYIEFDDALLNSALMMGVTFSINDPKTAVDLNDLKENYNSPPDLKIFTEGHSLDSSNEMTMTGLSHSLLPEKATASTVKRELAQVFYNESRNDMSYIAHKYLDTFLKLGITLKFYQNHALSQLNIYNSDFELIGLIMPRQLRNNDLETIIKTQAKKEEAKIKAV